MTILGKNQDGETTYIFDHWIERAAQNTLWPFMTGKCEYLEMGATHRCPAAATRYFVFLHGRWYFQDTCDMHAPDKTDDGPTYCEISKDDFEIIQFMSM